MKLGNKVAIITGAGRNIGEEIARTFAQEGARVAVVDLDPVRKEKFAARSTRKIQAAHFLAVQLAPYGIRVNSISPNRIGSPVGEDVVPTNRVVKNLVGRRGTPKDIAWAVLFLASEESDFITAIDIPVDGGALAVRS